MFQIVIVEERLFPFQSVQFLVETEEIFRQTFRDFSRREIVCKFLLPRKEVPVFGKNSLCFVLDVGERRDMPRHLCRVVLFQAFFGRKRGTGKSARDEIVRRRKERRQSGQNFLGVRLRSRPARGFKKTPVPTPRARNSRRISLSGARTGSRRCEKTFLP